MTIAVSEVKPKKSNDMTEVDYNIEVYTINPVNIDTNPNIGRGKKERESSYTYTELNG